MIRMLLDIKGEQTGKHCSQTSSIGACEKLNVSKGRCKLLKQKLEYDWDQHAYKRCKLCLYGGIA